MKGVQKDASAFLSNIDDAERDDVVTLRQHLTRKRTSKLFHSAHAVLNKRHSVGSTIQIIYHDLGRSIV